MKSRTLTTAMAIALGAGMVASAVAAPSHVYEELSIKVSYEDLNIDNDKDAQTLYRRLKQASAEVCGYARYTAKRPRFASMESKLCYQKTLSKAVQQVKSEKLSKLHSG